MYGPVSSVEENNVLFMDGKSEAFDAIIFATGYKSTANKWLEVQEYFQYIFSSNSCVFHIYFSSVLHLLYNILSKQNDSLLMNVLQDGNETLDEDGFPKKGFPNQWKGSNGLYCAGFARRGLAGISMDAINIADDIKKAYK